MQQMAYMDASSAHSRETIALLSRRFSGPVSDLFYRIRKIGVDVPQIESDPRLPHWMEDIARFLSAAGPAIKTGDIERATDLAADLREWLRD